MKGRMLKKLAVMFACMAMLCASVTTAFASYGVMPCYDVVSYADACVEVSADGELMIATEYAGDSSVTKAVITTCIEKKTLLFFWSDEAEWSDTIYSSSYSGTDSYQLPEEGTYRVTVTFEVYGSDGSVDTITSESEVEW
ncbi:MAG: hypothetical protein J6B39_04785 [Lachnospiraceae bacterium]|nr:hypothetical protein [Lachnospiraceae bacterium]